MIWEIIQYYRTPVKFDYVKPMGFLKEGVAMIARAKRCHASWQPHYQNCQSVIRQTVESLQKRNTETLDLELGQQNSPHNSQKLALKKVVIFGAGSLNDLPLAYLSERFTEVLLVDLVFLPAARKQTKAFPNIQLVEQDVTESLSDIYLGKTLVSSPKAWLEDVDIDLVISLNLITQLPLIPVRWLFNKYNITESQAQEIGQAIVQNHLDYLQTFRCPVCLIADRDNSEMNLVTQTTENIDPWWGVEDPPVVKEWLWNLIPKGERSSQFSQTNRVGVSYLNDSDHTPCIYN